MRFSYKKNFSLHSIAFGNNNIHTDNRNARITHICTIFTLDHGLAMHHRLNMAIVKLEVVLVSLIFEMHYILHSSIILSAVYNVTSVTYRITNPLRRTNEPNLFN